MGEITPNSAITRPRWSGLSYGPAFEASRPVGSDEGRVQVKIGGHAASDDRSRLAAPKAKAFSERKQSGTIPNVGNEICNWIA